MKIAFLLPILLFGIVRANEIDNETSLPSEETLKRGLSSKCASRETSSCIAVELVGYVDRMLRTASFQLSDDMMIVDESNGASADIPVKPESLARAGTSLEDQAQQLIMDKLWNFATTRSIRYRLLDNADVVIAGKQEKDGSLGVGVTMKAPKVIESGRARNKNMGPFLAAAAMKMGLLGALTFKGLYLMVGKALLISKIALLLATIIGLKKLFSPQLKNVTYEVFTYPTKSPSWKNWKKNLESLMTYMGPPNNGASADIPVKPESLARAGTSLEDQAQQLIMDKLWNFATTRSIRYRLLDNADVVIAGKQEKDGSLGVGVTMKAPKVIESGRARNKNMGPFLAAAAMKMGLLGALTFKGLYLMVGKALLISKIALLLATIIGLKKLFSPQLKNVTYEVFTYPTKSPSWKNWKKNLESLMTYMGPPKYETISTAYDAELPPCDPLSTYCIPPS